MNTLQDFKLSLTDPNPPAGLPVHLKSLWFDGKDDWKAAHHLIDHLNDKDSTRVHAYLHRKEGDTWNADYWYNRAGVKRPDISLEAEWELLVQQYLKA